MKTTNQTKFKKTHLVVYTNGELDFAARDSKKVVRLIEITSQKQKDKVEAALACLCCLGHNGLYMMPHNGELNDMEYPEWESTLDNFVQKLQAEISKGEV